MERFPHAIHSGLWAAALLAWPGSARADSTDAIVKAFQDNRSYVQPFATLLGSLTNSGWYQSSAVPAGFGFYIGLPISITQISDQDRSFTGTFVDDGCRLYHEHAPGGAQHCNETTVYKAPTIFGRFRGPVLHRSILNADNDAIIGTTNIPLSDGKRDLASLNWLPFVEPQLAVSYKYTEIKLRYIGLPLSRFSVSMPGAAIQHDLASFLPPLPVSLSVAANITWLNASWTPGGHIDGILNLTGESHSVGILAGYTYARWLEIFVDTGWEGATLKSGGFLVIRDRTDSTNNQSIKPDMDLAGRNGFRAALNLAFHFGYDAVLSQNAGAELGNQVSILAYRFKK